jgi:hypothetical protein
VCVVHCVILPLLDLRSQFCPLVATDARFYWVFNSVLMDGLSCGSTVASSLHLWPSRSASRRSLTILLFCCHRVLVPAQFIRPQVSLSSQVGSVLSAIRSDHAPAVRPQGQGHCLFSHPTRVFFDRTLFLCGAPSPSDASNSWFLSALVTQFASGCRSQCSAACSRFLHSCLLPYSVFATTAVSQDDLSWLRAARLAFISKSKS